MMHDENFIKKVKAKIEKSKSDPNFNKELEKSIREIFNGKSDLNHAISFFENDEYRFCHPDDVKNAADDSKEILVQNNKWTKEYEEKYKYIIALYYRYVGDDSD